MPDIGGFGGPREAVYDTYACPAARHEPSGVAVRC